MKKLLTICLLLACSGSVLAEPNIFGDEPVEEKEQKNYLCIPDYSVGYINKNGKWQPTNFNIEGEKYILKKGDDSIWYWNEFGNSREWGANKCNEEFDEYGFLTCKYIPAEIHFNRDTLRFMMVNRIGYVVAQIAIDKGDDNDTPHMTIGTCTPL